MLYGLCFEVIYFLGDSSLVSVFLTSTKNYFIYSDTAKWSILTGPDHTISIIYVFIT